jgi:hypothetical protein
LLKVEGGPLFLVIDWPRHSSVGKVENHCCHRCPRREASLGRYINYHALPQDHRFQKLFGLVLQPTHPSVVAHSAHCTPDKQLGADIPPHKLVTANGYGASLATIGKHAADPFRDRILVREVTSTAEDATIGSKSRAGHRLGRKPV